MKGLLNVPEEALIYVVESKFPSSWYIINRLNWT